MNVPAKSVAVFACVALFLMILDRKASVGAQVSEIDAIRELGLIIDFERMPLKPRVTRRGFGFQNPGENEGTVNGDSHEQASDISMIRAVCIPADWNGNEALLKLDRDGVESTVKLRLASLPENAYRPEKSGES